MNLESFVFVYFNSLPLTTRLLHLSTNVKDERMLVNSCCAGVLISDGQ